MLEGTSDSIAFAFRGGHQPPAGSLIQIDQGEARSAGNTRQAVVRRVRVAHDDLCIVAAQIVELRPFPPVAVAESASVEAKPGPRRLPRRLILAAV